MINLYLGYIASIAATLLVDAQIAQAAPRLSPQQRVVLYQKETRAVLSNRHWIISADRPGMLVADRVIGLGGSSEAVGLTRVTISFKPDTSAHTGCIANVVQYYYTGKNTASGKKALVAIPGDNYENVHEIQEIMKISEKRLSKLHPEYTAKE